MKGWGTEFLRLNPTVSRKTCSEFSGKFHLWPGNSDRIEPNGESFFSSVFKSVRAPLYPLFIENCSERVINVIAFQSYFWK